MFASTGTLIAQDPPQPAMLLYCRLDTSAASLPPGGWAKSSRLVTNPAHPAALQFMRYDYVRIHQTLRCTPAMEAGLTDHNWIMEELCALPPSGAYSKIEKEIPMKP